LEKALKEQHVVEPFYENHVDSNNHAEVGEEEVVGLLALDGHLEVAEDNIPFEEAKR